MAGKPAEHALPAVRVDFARCGTGTESGVSDGDARPRFDGVEEVGDCRRWCVRFPRRLPRLNEPARRIDLENATADVERHAVGPYAVAAPGSARAQVDREGGGSIELGRTPPLRELF